MTKVKVRHYVVKGGKAFWQPTPKMKALGFHAVPLGPDGPDGWAIAERWNGRWDKTRNCEVPSPAWPQPRTCRRERVEEASESLAAFMGPDAEPFEIRLLGDQWTISAVKTGDDLDTLQALRKQGMSVRDIAERTGLSKSTVQRKLKIGDDDDE